MAKHYLATCDGLLEEIRRKKAELSTIENLLTRKIEEIRAPYAHQLNNLNQAAKGLEKELVALTLEHKAEIFPAVIDGSARVDIDHGALIYQAFDWVIRSKGMLSTLQKMDRSDLMKIETSVNWDAFKPLPDDELQLLGTRRETREKIEYEIKEG